MKNLFLTLVLLILTSFAFAQNPAHPEMLVSTDWLSTHLKDPNLVLLQFAKDDADFNAGHIPGSRRVSADRLFIKKGEVESELPPVADLVKMFEELGVSNDSRIVIYTTEWPPMAPRIYFTLDYLGIAGKASLLDGGLDKWKSEKRPLATDDPKPKPGKIAPHPHPELVATLSEVKAASANSAGPTIVDSRPARRYTAGHIPGAVHVYWQDVVTANDKNQLLDASAIQKAYSSAGARPGKKLITYCEIGWQASHDYFTAKYLGYDVKMYDGSFNEWNDVAHQPVVKGDKPH